MTSRGFESYANTQMQTAHRGDILVSLFDGALRFADQAKAAIEGQDPAAKGRAVDRLLAIIMEFSRTLEPARAPELSGSLQALYAYYIERTQEASMKMDPAPLVEVRGHLSRMRDTWAEAVRIAKAEKVS